jgi:o-succinylbenzoate---CoA ligase
VSTLPRLLALQLPAGPAFLEALRGAWDDGDAVAPLDPALPAPALERLLAELRPHTVRDDSDTRRLPDPEPVAPGTALVVATSGSTGPPRGVVLSHRALGASVDASLTRLGAERGDRWLCCLPLAHVAGLLVVLRAWRLGSEPVVHPRFDPALVRAAAAAGVAYVSLVPTMLGRLLDAGADLSGFRAVLLGGARAPPALLNRAAAAGVTVVRTYGMTETCGGCVYDGVALDGVGVAVDADDRIRIRGDVLFDGYRSRPQQTAAMLRDGWLHTFDLGRWDPDGRLEVVGRADDVILSGGEKVPAGAVEVLLAGHPGVAEVVVLGRPDPDWGQAVVALVVPAAALAPPTLAEARALVAAAAPRAWAPRDLVVVDALPRLGSGKPDRRAAGGLLDAR